MAKKKRSKVPGSYDKNAFSLLNDKWIVASLVLVTITKILLIPSYRSTDFDVHRNWLAITRHLPLKEWYFDDVNGTTVHTLDYPPTFAYFEYLLSNHPITTWLLDSGRLDARCLDLLPDTDNTPSMACVTFHRSTVIISDVIYWIGAAIATTAVATTNNHRRWIYLFLILNPGLLWLDHIHFQYNGMLLGILLASLGLLIRGGKSSSSTEYHACHLLGAMLFALLLTMKHLYMTLAPLYFVYLLRNYCMDGATTTTTGATSCRFRFVNFLMLGLVTACSLILPFVPFLLQPDPMSQMKQMLSRLFPFGRGLVHDYWAANVWALYMLSDKIVKFVGRKVLLGDEIIFALPELTPPVVACCLLIGLIPGLIHVWKQPEEEEEEQGSSASSSTKNRLINAIVFCSLSSFMLGWHVHEKAIMTSIIPLALLVGNNNNKESNLFFLRINTIGLFGLFPLLFRSIELPFKLVSYIGYLLFIIIGLEQLSSSSYHPKIKKQNGFVVGTATSLDFIVFCILCFVGFFLEILHPIFIYPKLEFLPLLITSITCSIGLIITCWIMSFQMMMGRMDNNNTEDNKKDNDEKTSKLE